MLTKKLFRRTLDDMRLFHHWKYYIFCNSASKDNLFAVLVRRKVIEQAYGRIQTHNERDGRWDSSSLGGPWLIFSILRLVILVAEGNIWLVRSILEHRIGPSVHNHLFNCLQMETHCKCSKNTHFMVLSALLFVSSTGEKEYNSRS